jgi:hypothetical protein
VSVVSDLLAQSRAQHLAHHQAQRDGKNGAERVAIEAAKNLRDQAHALDPQHLDSSWRDDTVPHQAIADFYTAYLATHA